MKKLLLLSMVLFPLILLGGTTGKISGIVIDSETNEPIPGANVIVSDGAYGAATNLEGYYFINNIAAGSYTIKVSVIGYKLYVVNNVKAIVDLTTIQDFKMETEVIKGDVVVVEASRPVIQQDITASRQIQSGEEMMSMPVDDFQGALQTIAGAVMEDGALHFRGGREQEVIYLLDNSAMQDPLSGGNDTRVNNFAIQETHTMTGGFSAEYGNAQSGVVNIITRDGDNYFNGRFRYTTSKYGLENISTVRTDEVPENMDRFEFGVSGPVPLIKKMTYLVTGDFENADRRFLHESREEYSVMGKVTWRPINKMTIRANGLMNKEERGYFSNLWKKTVVEDEQVRYRFRDDNEDGINDNNNFVEGWYGNGALDSEDIGIMSEDGVLYGAHNGILDFFDENGNGEWDLGEPTEDLNENNSMDIEDLNHNGSMDSFFMEDHLAINNAESNQIGFSILHQISKKTFYELKIDRYYTKSLYNPKEQINEDIDGDGRLDSQDENILSASGVYQWIDLDGDGYFDRGNEDVNGNGLLDEYGIDMYEDFNFNTYVDASEIGPAPRDYYAKMGIPDPESTWMRWADIPAQGQKDYDGFYTYGSGTTWDRTGWLYDESYVYSLKLDIDSQVNKNNRIRVGIDAKMKDIFKLDGTDRYGYGEKFKVKPYQIAAYMQDKIEFGDMIMNIGLRYDLFDANWDRFPNNQYDPTWDADEEIYRGNEDLNSNGALDEGEDANGNGVLDQPWIAEKYQTGIDSDGNPTYMFYPGDIKDPRGVELKDFISPRIGVSYPITDRDKMFFSYGKYFSAPIGNNLYRNLEFDLGGGFPVIGNPALEPEKTTAYEAGIIHAFRDNSTIELKGFFKNITGLTNSIPIYYTVRDWFSIYTNADYGTVRGFEMTYNKRTISLGALQLGGLLTYTFQIAKNKASDTFAGYLTEWAGLVHPTEETYTSWDQRHTVNVNIDIRTARDLGPLLGGWSMNIMSNYGSGTRWTPPKGQDKAQLDNTEIMPQKYTTDLRFAKQFTLFEKTQLEMMLDVRNLFDRKNIIDIADEEWYAADLDGNGTPDYDPMGKYDDPTVFSRGRLARVGIQLIF